MQHYAIFLRAFNYDIRYKRSEQNANADALSRLPDPRTYENVDVIDVFLIDTIQSIMPNTPDTLITATNADVEIGKVMRDLQSGRDLSSKDTWNINPQEFNIEQGILMRGYRVVIPKSSRTQVLQELHAGHFGTIRMKALARGHCWWPNLSNDIENLARTCAQCQIYKHNPNRVEKHIWEPATKPFERVHVDYAGPFLNHTFFILVDAYTKWPEVFITKGMTSEETIQICNKIFARFGSPAICNSDNGPAFESQQFRDYLRSLGIKWKPSAPYHPATNGQAERYVQTIKNALTKLNNCKNIENDLQNILMQYRITPHTVTGLSPAKLMFNYNVTTKLDIMKRGITKKSGNLNEIIDLYANNNPKIHTYNENISVREFHVGQRVSARNYTSQKP